MKKILIIEDDSDFRELMKNRLSYSGFEVYEAENGVEGLKKVKEISPDLILLDIKMPEMDGYSLIKELKANSQTASIPIIVVTAYKDMEELFKLEGIQDYVVKTQDSNLILEKINKILKDRT